MAHLEVLKSAVGWTEAYSLMKDRKVLYSAIHTGSLVN